MDVDCHCDAYLLPREPALPGLPESVGEIRVHDICLVDPHPVPQDDPVLVAIHGREHPVAPFPCRLVGDPADLGRSVERHAEAHEPHELDPCGHIRLAVLEDRAREGVVSPAAAAAPEPLQPALLVPVPPRPLRPAGRAGWLRTVEAGGIGEGPESDGFPAFPLVHGRRQQCEVAGIQAGDHLCEGIPLRHGGIPSAAWSLPGGIVAKQRARQAPGRILCLAAPSYHACWAQAHMFVTRVLDC